VPQIVSPRPSPATIISLVALFVALGGTSYAAIALAPRNSVGSAQVINGSLVKKDLSRKTVAALKGNRGRAGVQGAQGPAGAAGTVGAAGPAGPTGAAGATGPAGAAGATGPVGATGPAGAVGATGAAGAAGASGVSGATGPRGPSDGLSIRGSTTTAWTGAEQTLVSLTLTPGKWLIATKTTVVNQDAARREFRCELQVAGTVIDRNYEGSTGVPLQFAGGVDRTTSALTNGVSVSTSSTASLVCIALSGVAGLFVEPTMTAVDVETLNGA
jgi:hypothetical protein